jgi:DNA-binding NtrC family response regulator
MLAGRTYDLVIVDPFMTGEVHGDGALVLVPTIRRFQPDVPVVILSAYASSSIVEAPTYRTTILRKPQSLPFLMNLITTLLRKPGEERTGFQPSENENREV